MSKLAPKKMRSVFNTLLIVALCSFPELHAQIGINVPANESPQAQLDIRQGEDTLPGMLIPRVTSLPVAPEGETIEEGLMGFLQGENPNFYVYVDEAWQTIGESAGVDTTPPSVPRNLAASNPTGSTIDLNWDASTDNSGTVAGYKIYDDSDNSLMDTVTGSTSTTISGLSPNTSYTFYVTAYDAAGNESNASDTATGTTTEITVVTINEGYFETGDDGWVTYDRSQRENTGNNSNSCEQSHSMAIRHNKNGSRIELQNVDLSTYTYVTVDFEYKTSTNWASDDYFAFKFNGSELGRFYESGSCVSASIIISNSDYSFGSSDLFRFEGEMNAGNKKVYIDAVVIKGYADATCQTSFEDDYGCWVNGNNTSRVSSNANTGSYSVQFEGNNGNDSYIETENPIDASSFSSGLIKLYYDGNGEVESNGQYGDYLIIQYYDTGSSSWRVLPGAAFGVNQSYTQLDYTIPSQYLTATLQLRIVFDATASDEFMYLDDTEILFFD